MWKGYHLNVSHILKLENHMSIRESMWLITSKQLAICNFDCEQFLLLNHFCKNPQSCFNAECLSNVKIDNDNDTL